MKSLENQAKKAEKYFEIKKEYKEVSIELAKAALEGFNITYRDLNEQTDKQKLINELNWKQRLPRKKQRLNRKKLALLKKKKRLQEMQHAFNDLLQKLRSKENEKNLAAQRLQFSEGKENQACRNFLQKAEGQLKGLEESIQFTRQQVDEEAGKAGRTCSNNWKT